MSDAAYDAIGKGYARTRRSDPRIHEQIVRALGDAETIVNVGAGTGSYEPADRRVVALEPSAEMIHQRSADAAPVVQGDATDLPFGPETFDAAMAILTIHHWPDQSRGLRELSRVARSRIVILTHDTDELDTFWFVEDYFPEVRVLDSEKFPTTKKLARSLDIVSIEPVLVPHDCKDGFLAAYWSRPEAYLDEGVRAGISFFHWADPSAVALGIRRLSDDLSSGRWDECYGHLRSLEQLDFGYRLVVSNP